MLNKTRFASGLLLGLSFAAGLAYAANQTAYWPTATTPVAGNCVNVAAGDGSLGQQACTGGVGTGTANTWTAAQTFSTRVSSTPVVLSGAAPIPDASTTNVFTLTLSAATTIANPTNLVAGETLTFIITQAAGGYAVTWGANYKFSGTAPTMSTGSGKVDVYTCTSPAGTNCYMAGVSQNF
jgi:hypothetical protein